MEEPSPYNDFDREEKVRRSRNERNSAQNTYMKSPDSSDYQPMGIQTND
jgi:hypothetical protein